MLPGMMPRSPRPARTLPRDENLRPVVLLLRDVVVVTIDDFFLGSKRGHEGSPTSCSSSLASASRRAPFGSTYPFEMMAARTGAMRRIAGRHSCGITQKRSSLRIFLT